MAGKLKAIRGEMQRRRHQPVSPRPEVLSTSTCPCGALNARDRFTSMSQGATMETNRSRPRPSVRWALLTASRGVVGGVKRQPPPQSPTTMVD
jgi:hypothetical protein